MPFAVFREHQRKLLAVFAIMAMIGFVLSDTLPRWMNSGGTNPNNLEVAELYGKKIYQSDLDALRQSRIRANKFMGFASRFDIGMFGGLTRPELIDALILSHEADRLGIPSDAEFARSWISSQTTMNPGLFELILSQLEPKVSGEQLLHDIATQARILLAGAEVDLPIVTPLDVYRTYRDQTERTSFKAVPYVVEGFTSQVGEPTEAEILDLYEKYKDVLPETSRTTPGFKIPRKVNIEFLRIDFNQIVRRIKPTIPESELKTYYETNKTKYPLDGLELPVNLFAGAPELTPPRYSSFEFERESIADILAREKASKELEETFAEIQKKVDKFADEYYTVVDDIAELKKEGQSTDKFLLPECDLRMMTNLIDESEIPSEGKNLVVLALWKGQIQIRIFDANGKEVEDTDSSRIKNKSQFADAASGWKDLWPPHDLTKSEKDRVLTELAPTIGFTIVPRPQSIAPIAAQFGMKYEETGLIDRHDAETYPIISQAKEGLNPNRSSDAKSFADLAFGSKSKLYESFEMHDDFLGDRFVVRRIANVPAHVADLKEVREQVVRAWKLAKARPLAKQAAEEYADKLRKMGGQIKDLMVGTRPVIAIESITKLQPGPIIPSRSPLGMDRGPAVQTEIRDIRQASPAFMDALFALKPGEVVVEPDLPESTYYVVALENRQPVPYQILMGQNGALSSYWGETITETRRKTREEAMTRLREQAGYKPEKYENLDKNRDDDES